MIGDLNPATWRIDVYEIKPEVPFTGVITDISQLYTTDLTIKKQRNYPDEIHFTLDLQQLEERADKLHIESHAIVEPYRHKVMCYRNDEFIAQGIVVKVSANLNNQSKNTLEVNCVDTLGLLEKRLIHQDYGEGSWADFAKQVVYDAQHEPNRIYNYAWEGDGVGIDNAWFRGWRYLPGDAVLREFPEWEPNHLYSMYDRCTYDARFWEAKENVFYSGETFSESNWTLLGVMDPETGEVSAAYGVWREDDEEKGPTGTALGGWGGTSSCHMTASSFKVNNAGQSLTSISMADSLVSTSLVAPFKREDMASDDKIYTRVMSRDTKAAYVINSTTMGTKTRFKAIDAEVFQDELLRTYPEFLSNGDFVTSIEADDQANDITIVRLRTKNGKSYEIWRGEIYNAKAIYDLEIWGITVPNFYILTFNRNDAAATGMMPAIRTAEGQSLTVPDCTFGPPPGKHWSGKWNTSADGLGRSYSPGNSIVMNDNTTLYAMWEAGERKYLLSYKPTSSSSWTTETFIDDQEAMVERMNLIIRQYEQSGTKYDIKLDQQGY